MTPTRAGASRPRTLPGIEPLPLRLPAPPPLPGRILPEVAVPCMEAFDDPAWLFSVDWSGARALLFVDTRGSVRLQGETLEDLSPRFPELMGVGAGLAGRAAVLDGVIAVLDAQGRPDLAGFGRRLAAGASAAVDLPAVYLAFDVLHLAERTTLGWPLEDRLDALGELAPGSEGLQVPDHVAGRGVALAEAALDRGLTGISARRALAPYRPGVASPDRLRIALSDQTNCAVAGMVVRPARPVRLVLGEWSAGHLVFAGQVTGPAEPEVAAWLQRRTRGLAGIAPTLEGAVSSGTTWLRPELGATVAHSGRSPAGVPADPVLVAVRDDLDLRWCVRRAPVAPPAPAPRRAGFAPTVLLPLPLGETALAAHPPRSG